jgi:hypothetical protein
VAEEPEPRRVRALDEQQLELLRHPAARVDGVLGRLQGALAKVVVPDCSVLKSYCERANLARNPALARAMTDATVILGLGGVEVFVSRGDKTVGLRACRDTSFLLIGGDQVTPRRCVLDGDRCASRSGRARTFAMRTVARPATKSGQGPSTSAAGLGMLDRGRAVLKPKAPASICSTRSAPTITRWRQARRCERARCRRQQSGHRAQRSRS